jgi:cytochrome c oxidase subunit III
MNLMVAAVALVAGIFVWWLAVRRLTTKSWEAQGTYDGRDIAQMAGPAAPRIGLWVFLAVATSFFALFITAYLMRMNPEVVKGIDLRDWRPVTEPQILWANTVMLILGSACMQMASSSLRRKQFDLARAGLFAGGLFAVAFLAGQWLAWRQLQAAGYYAAGNPANAFFYVLTGLHGLHLLGGLFVWARSAGKMAQGRTVSGATQLSVELCTVYWHYLLLVWLVLFGLLLIT